MNSAEAEATVRTPPRPRWPSGCRSSTRSSGCSNSSGSTRPAR